MASPKDLHQRVQEQNQSLAQSQTAAVTPADNIRAMIAGNMNRIQQALPDAGVTPERLATVAFTVIRKSPALMECKPESLLDCIIRSAELGLNPGILGHAYILPYGSEATFIIGYQGMLELARRSGQVSMIYAKPVYTEDEFRYQFGLNPDLVHIPFDGEQVREWENLTHVYMVARFKDGGHHFGVMTKAEVEAHRDRYSKGLDRKVKGEYTSPWRTAPVQMALKTVIRQEWKFLPVSTEVREAVAATEMAEAEVIEGKGQTIWTRASAMQMLSDDKPSAEPAPEPAANKAADDHQGAQDGPKPAKTGRGKQKAQPAPDTDDSGAITLAWCQDCGHQVEVAADATEADLVTIVCPGCHEPGKVTCQAPVADGQGSLLADDGEAE